MPPPLKFLHALLVVNKKTLKYFTNAVAILPQHSFYS